MDYNELSREELIEQINKHIENSKEESKMAALLGGLGVAPKHFAMYQESVSKIREFENTLK